MARGRKSKYHTHVQPRLKEIKEWAEKGLTEAEMQKFLNVSHESFNNYKHDYPELVEALNNGKAFADDLVEQALYKNALGYYYTEDAVTNKGDVVEVRKYSKPNTTAQIFWLKNRRRDQWRDKHDIEHSGEVDIEVNLDGFMDDQIVNPDKEDE